MPRWVLLVLLGLLLCPTSLAQSGELAFNRTQAERLHKYAQLANKEGFPGVARRVWLMVLSEYDPDHDEARAHLGYERIADSWVERGGLREASDEIPSPKKAALLQKKWTGLSKKLAKAHLGQARKWRDAQRLGLSRRHYARVLFFAPDNPEAQAALGHETLTRASDGERLPGLTGTGHEQLLFDRSMKIEDVVGRQARKDYAVERLPDDDRNALLDRAELDYISVRSEHFIVRGDFEEQELFEAARYGERTIAVLKVIIEGFAGFHSDASLWTREWAFFRTRTAYRKCLQVNATLLSPELLKYCLEKTPTVTLESQRQALRVSTPGSLQAMYDAAVGGVSRDIFGLRSSGLREGVSLTIVGRFFNYNRMFLVGLERDQRTSSGERASVSYSPDMDTWRDLAIESAWRLTRRTPAAGLPLIDAARFTDDARIKAWSFCDYLVRRDPTLLLDLDRLRDEASAGEVERRFTEDHDGLSLAALEQEWRDFWTGASPVLAVLRGDSEPLTAVSKDVEEWIEQLNEIRKTCSSGEVGWSAAYSTRCRDHVRYLLANKSQRGPAAEQCQLVQLEGGSRLGDLFAHMALVETRAKKPGDVLRRWLGHPGYRDALLDYRLHTVGLYVERDVLVMDVTRGVGAIPAGGRKPVVYPSSTRESVPTSMAVADLGPELARLLEKNGHGDLERIGYPISLHQFGHSRLRGRSDSYKCTVTIEGQPVEGLLQLADSGSNRHTAAPGMVVFYPLAPLRKGVRVDVVWTYEDSRDGKRERFPAEFHT